jgi:type IV secretory pathway VirB2 component (pilin)
MPRAAQLLALALSVLVVALMPAAAVAAPQATLTAKLRPAVLGKATAISVGFHLRPSFGEELPPLSNFALGLPEGMGFAASQLGLATCAPERLLELGTGGCPAESLIGNGSAQVRVPFGTGVVSEQANVFIYMAKPVAEQTTTLLYFDGRKPVLAPLVLESQVVTPEGSSDSILETPVQTILTAPEGPQATLVAMRTTLGPAGLRYFRREHGRRVPYRPEGIGLPAHCPRGGFRFAASFRFGDESQTRATATVPCPRAPAGIAERRPGQG